ncbi:MAG: hypothetical protein CM15mV119_200 [uncultured marine virus]|nr:MAG: hypothetical protein CM15mV119_200 [uncultured marine virus]
MTLTQINKAGLDEIARDHVFTIGVGSSAYTFQGEGVKACKPNPTLYLTRGKRIDLRMAQVVTPYAYKHIGSKRYCI